MYRIFYALVNAKFCVHYGVEVVGERGKRKRRECGVIYGKGVENRDMCDLDSRFLLAM